MILTRKAKEWLRVERQRRDSPAQAVQRAAVIVRGKDPYGEWVRATWAEEAANEQIEPDWERPAVYLLPEVGFVDEFEHLLVHNWRRIFEDRLRGWALDQRKWPQGRTCAMFHRWFEVVGSDHVADLVDGRLRKNP